MEKKTKKITVAVAPTDYTRVRVWCAERNITVSAIVQAFLTDLPDLASFRGLTKADLPRKVRAHRKAQLYIRIERPADPVQQPVGAQSDSR
jgi:hypothetical protein